MIKKILIFLLFALLVIQAFRPEKNLQAEPSSKSIATLYTIPADVKNLLDAGCNDCHSNNTKYPWYSNIQPVAWWLDDHIRDGKKELNLDSFAAYNLRRQYHKMEEVIEMVKEKEMPLESYTWIHKDAKLTDAQRALLTGWSEGIIKAMQQKYPIDSLVRKK